MRRGRAVPACAHAWIAAGARPGIPAATKQQFGTGTSAELSAFDAECKKSRLMYKSGMCVSTFDDVEGGSAVVRALPGSRFCTVEARSNKSRGRLGRAPGCECPGSHFCAPLGLVSMSGREEGGSLGEGELQGELANTREQRRWLSSGFQGNGCFLRSGKD